MCIFLPNIGWKFEAFFGEFKQGKKSLIGGIVAELFLKMLLSCILFVISDGKSTLIQLILFAYHHLSRGPYRT